MRRIGVATLQKIARELCKYITQFGPIIRATYPSNVALATALAAAMAACEVLEQELTAVREVGD